MNRQKALKWCIVETLDNEACKAYLSWVTDGIYADKVSKDIIWLLAHCHDGVTWGRLNNDQCWLLSSMFFSDICPCISGSNLLEIRLYGLEREILIWRTENGFSGRCLIDNVELDNSESCRPDNETRILLGDRLLEPSRESFSLVGTAKGIQQAVPLECTDKDFTGGYRPLRIMLRHYFEEDQETGAVRVAASRLVKNFKEVQ